MEKVLFYAMQGEKMCFLHVLMNAWALKEKGAEVKVIMEGKSVTLIDQLKDNPLMQQAVKQGLIAGVCRACSQQLGVLDSNEKSGLTLLDDMNGHAGMASYGEAGYHVIVM